MTARAAKKSTTTTSARTGEEEAVAYWLDDAAEGEPRLLCSSRIRSPTSNKIGWSASGEGASRRLFIALFAASLFTKIRPLR